MRCSAYAGVQKFADEQADIERTWPAYTQDYTLRRIPKFFWDSTTASMETWQAKFQARSQHVLSRLNYHIHPLKDGVRKPLGSCLAGGKKTCRHDYPLTHLLCDEAIFVCYCVAAERCLPVTGPRSFLGTCLSRRNDENLNATARVLAFFTCSNSDIKFPHRIPIIAESHEEQQVYDVRRGKCYEEYDMQQQIQDMQAGLAAAAGYFGGYTSKMQDIGKKELQRLEQGLYRKLETEQRTAQAR